VRGVFLIVLPLFVRIKLDELATEFKFWFGGVEKLLISVSLFMFMLFCEEEVVDCCFRLPRRFLKMDLNAGDELPPFEDWLLAEVVCCCCCCFVGVVLDVETQ
jgi:hypothetical protein